MVDFERNRRWPLNVCPYNHLKEVKVAIVPSIVETTAIITITIQPWACCYADSNAQMAKIVAIIYRYEQTLGFVAVNRWKTTIAKLVVGPKQNWVATILTDP